MQTVLDPETLGVIHHASTITLKMPREWAWALFPVLGLGVWDCVSYVVAVATALYDKLKVRI